eukprot:TRINITY_DN81409_c0_g1_i1.p1 TRINITY_DN81409_c0_g1~~TRINITY_DN81409_c0_g1_i1.p1  ORF type:complete len:248 (+),score=50.48 TRINITY_DN81409_c0_g1_i1:72-746(+)
MAIQHLLKFLPQLAVAASFAGSAVLMKIVPVMNILPKPISKQLVEAWGKFLMTPMLKPVSVKLGVTASQAMVGVAVAHLIAAALLILPSGDAPARVAGVWAMIVMVGAEYCTRVTGFVPPGVPKEMEFYVQCSCTLMHIALFLCGAVCVVKGGSVGLLPLILGKFKNKDTKTKTTASEKKPEPKTTTMPSKPLPAGQTGARKRESTPPPAGRGTAAERGVAART